MRTPSERCIAGCIDKKVIEFSQKALKNLASLKDDDVYTVLYFGETIEFHARMAKKYPDQFLSWFPATHAFMLAQLRPDLRDKNAMKAACYGLEANMAIWMSHKLPVLSSYKYGCSFNVGHCGCRWISSHASDSENTYVSYEKVDGVFLPLMVHPNLKDIRNIFGDFKTTQTFTSTQIINTPFI